MDAQTTADHVEMDADDYPLTIMVFTEEGDRDVLQWAVTVVGPGPVHIPPVAEWIGRPVQAEAMPAGEFLLRLKAGLS